MSVVAVIGGGAAGMMAAVSAAEEGRRVVLYEKNEKLGKKLFITGKGRCNVTNACETEELFGGVVNNAEFLYSAFYGFDNSQVMRFFEDAGCPLKIERGNRVFPVSDHSSDVIKALKKRLDELQVTVRLNTTILKVLVEETEEGVKVRGVRLASGKEERADAVVVATGGISYAATGSTGDGYRFAEKTGHSLTERRPSLVPLEAEESFCKDLMGLSLKNVEVALTCNKKELYRDFGEMLFTHFGVSGPLILSASSRY
ncbi:MAG: aminoacetone oxidase family FAD-binding enzyme, partial [Lachnospiraceae bacterium]|nr:aminoacetone oxidase family FAD-binding enzyme [Lachnospiraceae bacterium]